MVTTAWRFLAFAAVCAGVFGTGTAALLHDDRRVAEGLSIEGVALGGLTPAEALNKVENSLAPRLPKGLTLRHDGRTWTYPNDKFGRQLLLDKTVAEAYDRTRTGSAWQRGTARLRLAHRPVNLSVPITANRNQLEAVIGEVAEVVDREPQDAVVRDYLDGRIYFERDHDGLTVDIKQTADAALASTTFPPPAEVTLAVERVPAKVKYDELRGTLNTVLATYHTSMSHGYYGVMRENRAHNVRLCLARMNGTVLQPGETFSFNGIVGERKPEDGFRSSYVFYRKPDGSIEERWDTGGGICQLATTLFGTALRANLKIVERGNHSKPVHYAKTARDATVYYGVVDLKFQNALGHPILVWGVVKPNYDLEIAIVGDRSDQTKVELFSAVSRGARGISGSLWRSAKRADGQVLSDRELICHSFYPHEKPKDPPPAKPAAKPTAQPDAKPATTAPSAAPAAPRAPAPAAGAPQPQPAPQPEIDEKITP